MPSWTLLGLVLNASNHGAKPSKRSRVCRSRTRLCIQPRIRFACKSLFTFHHLFTRQIGILITYFNRTYTNAPAAKTQPDRSIDHQCSLWICMLYTRRERERERERDEIEKKGIHDVYVCTYSWLYRERKVSIERSGSRLRAREMKQWGRDFLLWQRGSVGHRWRATRVTSPVAKMVIIIIIYQRAIKSIRRVCPAPTGQTLKSNIIISTMLRALLVVFHVDIHQFLLLLASHMNHAMALADIVLRIHT